MIEVEEIEEEKEMQVERQTRKERNKMIAN
jgi:hypothetical protein